MNSEFSKDEPGYKEEQHQRSVLRQRFLRVMELMEGKKIDIETYQGADVSGVFRSADYEFKNIHVSNLNTPIGCIPNALVRTDDITTIKFDIDI